MDFGSSRIFLLCSPNGRIIFGGRSLKSLIASSFHFHYVFYMHLFIYLFLLIYSLHIYFFINFRFSEVSELSDTDSDVTVQDEDDDIRADVDGGVEAELGSSRGQSDEGHLKVKNGPWFVRVPGDMCVAVGRTLNCECLVAGQQPIGQH